MAYAVHEVFHYGKVSKEAYDNHNFPTDCNHDGNQWYLKSNTDH